MTSPQKKIPSKSSDLLGLRFHYNGVYSYLFVNGAEIHKFKANDSETVAIPLCLGSIPKDFSAGDINIMDMHFKFIILCWLWCHCSWLYIRDI